jgi:hypothetical protein
MRLMGILASRFPGWTGDGIPPPNYPTHVFPVESLFVDTKDRLKDVDIVRV